MRLAGILLAAAACLVSLAMPAKALPAPLARMASRGAPAPSQAVGEVVLAESFDSGSSGLPPGWQLVQFYAGVSSATVVHATSGPGYLQITSPKLNHAQVVFPVPVDPHSLYAFRAMARASGTLSTAAAAVVGIDGQIITSHSVRNTAAWQPLTVYINPGPQTSIKLTLGLGDFSSLNTGTADFENVTVTKIAAVPAGGLFITPPGVNLVTRSAVPQVPGPPDKHLYLLVALLTLGVLSIGFILLRANPVTGGQAAGTAPSSTDPADDSGRTR